MGIIATYFVLSPEVAIIEWIIWYTIALLTMYYTLDIADFILALFPVSNMGFVTWCAAVAALYYLASM